MCVCVCVCVRVCVQCDRKLFLYSVHDTTLMPCLMALGIFDMKWPPYAADITLELLEHRTTKEAFVKVAYLGQVTQTTHPQTRGTRSFEGNSNQD